MVGEVLLVCQCEEGNPNNLYTVAVYKTNAMKIVQINRNNDLSSFQLHFIINLWCGVV